MAERSEAEALAFLLQTWTEIEAKIKHVAERSDAALAFLLLFWTEIQAKIKNNILNLLIALLFAGKVKWSAFLTGW